MVSSRPVLLNAKLDREHQADSWNEERRKGYVVSLGRPINKKGGSVSVTREHKPMPYPYPYRTPTDDSVGKMKVSRKNRKFKRVKGVKSIKYPILAQASRDQFEKWFDVLFCHEESKLLSGVALTRQYRYKHYRYRRLSRYTDCRPFAPDSFGPSPGFVQEVRQANKVCGCRFHCS
jgi:hypothetical protein